MKKNGLLIIIILHMVLFWNSGYSMGEAIAEGSTETKIDGATKKFTDGIWATPFKKIWNITAGIFGYLYEIDKALQEAIKSLLATSKELDKELKIMTWNMFKDIIHDYILYPVKHLFLSLTD